MRCQARPLRSRIADVIASPSFASFTLAIAASVEHIFCTRPLKNTNSGVSAFRIDSCTHASVISSDCVYATVAPVSSMRCSAMRIMQFRNAWLNGFFACFVNAPNERPSKRAMAGSPDIRCASVCTSYRFIRSSRLAAFGMCLQEHEARQFGNG